MEAWWWRNLIAPEIELWCRPGTATWVRNAQLLHIIPCLELKKCGYSATCLPMAARLAKTRRFLYATPPPHSALDVLKNSNNDTT